MICADCNDQGDLPCADLGCPRRIVRRSPALHAPSARAALSVHKAHEHIGQNRGVRPAPELPSVTYRASGRTEASARVTTPRPARTAAAGLPPEPAAHSFDDLTPAHAAEVARA